MKRWPAIVLIAALLVAAVNHDRRPGAGRPRPAADRPGPLSELPGDVDLEELMPQVAPASAVASTWYCAGGTATGSSSSATPAGEEASADDEASEGEEGDGEGEGDDDGGGGEGGEPGDDAPPVPELVAEHRVVVANPTDRRLDGVLTAFPDEGEPVTTSLVVEPRSRAAVTLSDLVTAEYASATVELNGGGGLVEHEIRGPLGIAFAPCADHASRSWFFAAGSTVRGASETLFFFNPFPDDAVVDVSFSTEQGSRNPQAFQDLPIPAFSVRAVPVTDKVTVRQVVAASVDVRRGRIVVDRIQAWDGTPPPGLGPEGGEGPPASTPEGGGTGEVPPEERTEEEVPVEPPAAEPLPPVVRTGLTLSTGVRRPAGLWVFPDGRRIAGASEQFVIYNPTDRRAEVDLEIVPSDLEKFGEVDPISVIIAPGAVEDFDVDADERVPEGAAHHAVVRSLNGVPVVAERVASGSLFGSEGTTIVTGSAVAARRWHFASGAANDALQTQLIVMNPGDRTATVRVEHHDEGRSTPVPGAEELAVPAGGRVVVRVNEVLQAERLAVTVSSDRPVVAERATYRVDRIGITSSVGIPEQETAEVLRPG